MYFFVQAGQDNFEYINQFLTFEIMIKLIENLHVELDRTKVLAYLFIKDIVKLERACGSKETHQVFIELLPHYSAVVLPSSKHRNISLLEWFSKRRCKINSLDIILPGDNPALHIKNLIVEKLDLHIHSMLTLDNCKQLLEYSIVCKVQSIGIEGKQNSEVMEQLSACTGNVKQLAISYSNNCMDWLTADILSRWKLKEISFNSCLIKTHFIIQIVQTCTELTSINLDPYNIDDSVVIAIAEHCTKLETLLLRSSNITWTSLLALSERGLPLKELDIDYIPNIPTADIARRCSHALSCIRHIRTYYLNENSQSAALLIQYMTELTSICVDYYCDSYIPLLTQYCHKLTKIRVFSTDQLIDVVLPLCRTNPLLQELTCYNRCGLADTTLIELIHACPHLHTLYLPYETDITDTGILALSEYCPQLQEFVICRCHQITETSILQLLQRCRKLTKQYISHSSLSEETWTQLDSNTQKRVRRW